MAKWSVKHRREQLKSDFRGSHY